MSQDVVLISQSAGALAVDAAFSATYSGRLDVVQYTLDDKAWASQMHDIADFGCSERGLGRWGKLVTKTWVDPFWIRVEEARHNTRLVG